MMDRIVGGICIGCIAIIIVLAIIGSFVPDNGGTSYGDPTENMTDLEKAEYNGAQIVHVTTDDTFGYCGSYSTVYQEGYEYAVIVDDVFYYLYLDEAADLMEYSPSFNKVYIAEGQATSPSKVGEIRTGLIESGVYSNGQEVDAFEFPVDKPFSFSYKTGSIGGFDNVRIVDHLYLDGGAAGASADNSASSSSSSSSGLKIIKGEISTKNKSDAKTLCRVFVGEEHAGESAKISVLYSRNGTRLNEGKIVNVTVDSNGYVEVYSAKPFKRFPTKAHVKLYDSNGNVVDERNVNLEISSKVQSFD